jgi:hypothetical protein
MDKGSEIGWQYAIQDALRSVHVELFACGTDCLSVQSYICT